MIALYAWLRHSLVSFACGNKVALLQFIFLYFFNLTKWRQRLRADR
jgi:hypothetical protein